MAEQPQDPPADGIAGTPTPEHKTPYRMVLARRAEENHVPTGWIELGKYEGDETNAKRAALAAAEGIRHGIDEGERWELVAPPASSWRPKPVKPPNPRYIV